MKTYICIVARLSSSRLPNKALVKLVGNLNILEVLIKRLQTNFENNQIILATTNLKEDDKLIEIAKSQNIRFFRGPEKNVLDRIIFSCAQFRDCSNIVRVTGDNPLTDAIILKKMIFDHERNKCDYTFTESIPVGTRPEIISLKFLKFLSKNIKNKNNTEYLTFYLKKDLGQKNNLFEINYEQINSNETLTVDTFEDLQFLKSIFEESNLDYLVSLRDIIKIINLKKMIKKSSNIKPKLLDSEIFTLKNKIYE